MKSGFGEEHFKNYYLSIGMCQCNLVSTSNCTFSSNSLVPTYLILLLQTLSGHTSPVEYVKFNSGEDLVIAGSQSGTLKIWDLEAAKSKFRSC